MSLIRPARNPIYSIFDPKGLSILTNVRIGLSKLNSYKFRHNVRDTLNHMGPISDSTEDTEHFLLLYHAYAFIRCDLLDSLNAIVQTNGLSNLSLQEMTKVFLYGHGRLPADANEKILCRIHPCFRTLSTDKSKTNKSQLL